MSRIYDAKEAALRVFPSEKEDAIDLFLLILNTSEADFVYEMRKSPSEYLGFKTDE